MILAFLIFRLLIWLETRDFNSVFRAESPGKEEQCDRDLAIDARSLSKKHRRESYVHDVSFTIDRREVMGILGPSGAGKSTIFKMLTLAT